MDIRGVRVAQAQGQFGRLCGIHTPRCGSTDWTYGRRPWRL